MIGDRPTIAFGWMNKPLSEQLQAQHLPFSAVTADHFQRDSEAISRLRVRGVITTSEGDRAYDRLAKRVWAEVKRAAKASPPPSARPGEGGSTETLEAGQTLGKDDQ